MSSAPDVNDLHRAGKLPTNPMQGKPINGRRSPKFEAVPEPPPGMFEDEEPGLVAHPAAERSAAPDAPPQPPNDGGPWLSTDRIFSPLPPPAFVVPELQIGPGRASCFAAYAGAGKTIAMQSVALSLAADRPIWGQFSHRGPMRVRHADQDQGAGTFRRYQRLARGMGLTEADLWGRLEVSSFPELYLVDTPDDVWLRACDGVGLMILDALRGFVPGIDENDSAIQRYLMRLPKISEATGCTFLLAHHFGKPQMNAKPELERLRGSSGIGAALGSVFVFTGERDEPKTITHVKSHPEATGGLVVDFTLEIDDVASEDGADLHWGLRVAFKAAEPADAPQSPKQQVQAVADRALAALRDYPAGLSETKLRPFVKRDNALLPLALDSLAQSGSVERFVVAGRGGEHFEYRLASRDGWQGGADE